MVLLLLLVAAPAVLGHAEIEESNPAEGSTVTTPLKGFVTFDEEVSPDPARTFVVVVDSTDVEVARGEVSETDATRVDLQLPDLLSVEPQSGVPREAGALGCTLP